MRRMAARLGVGVVGIGWCASQHIGAFRKNPHTDVVALVGGDVDRVHASPKKNGLSADGARVSTRFGDLLEDPAIQVIDIATPNDLHAAQAVAAARAGKHILLEKPTGLSVDELIAIRDAVRTAGVRTIVSFELRYNAWLRFSHWMRSSGRLGTIHYGRSNYLSRILDWYSGWEWCRTVKGGGSQLLAARRRRAALGDRPRGRRGIGLSDEGDAGLRVADDDRRQPALRGRGDRARLEL